MSPRWTERLARLVRDRDGVTLRTRADARRYVLALPEFKQGYARWRRVAELLLEGAGAAELTRQLELALLLDGRLDVRFVGDQQVGDHLRQRGA